MAWRPTRRCVFMFLCLTWGLDTGSATASGGTSRDALLTGLAADIDARLPATFDIEAVRYKYPVDYNESMNTGMCITLAALLTSALVPFQHSHRT